MDDEDSVYIVCGNEKRNLRIGFLEHPKPGGWGLKECDGGSGSCICEMTGMGMEREGRKIRAGAVAVIGSHPNAAGTDWSLSYGCPFQITRYLRILDDYRIRHKKDQF